MSKRLFQLIVLIVVSLMSVYTLFWCMFIGANIVDDMQDPQVDLKLILLFFLYVLNIISVIYAWFNKKVGSILITSSTVLMFLFEIIARLQLQTSLFLLYAGLLVFGLLLLFSEIYTDKIFKQT